MESGTEQFLHPKHWNETGGGNLENGDYRSDQELHQAGFHKLTPSPDLPGAMSSFPGVFETWRDCQLGPQVSRNA